MDLKALSEVLHKFQESNKEFISQILSQNQQILQDAVANNTKNLPIPSFGKFHMETDRWSTYFLQMDQFFKANSVESQETKRSCFLSCVGGDILELLQKFFDGKAEEKTYNELIGALDNHFDKRQHILAARFKFYRTIMKPGQTYSEWIAELRGAARDCFFTCGNESCKQSYLDNKIRDMIVIYTPHEKVRAAALQKSNPSLEEVLHITKIFEATTEACKEIENKNNVDHEANYIQNTSKNHNFTTNRGVGRLKSCSDCGKSHQRENCFHFKNKTKCNKCGKLGHVANVCISIAANKYKNKFKQIRKLKKYQTKKKKNCPLVS